MQRMPFQTNLRQNALIDANGSFVQIIREIGGSKLERRTAQRADWVWFG
jgi:hypothetical protein